MLDKISNDPFWKRAAEDFMEYRISTAASKIRISPAGVKWSIWTSGTYSGVKGSIINFTTPPKTFDEFKKELNKSGFVQEVIDAQKEKESFNKSFREFYKNRKEVD